MKLRIAKKICKRFDKREGYYKHSTLSKAMIYTDRFENKGWRDYIDSIYPPGSLKRAHMKFRLALSLIDNRILIDGPDRTVGQISR